MTQSCVAHAVHTPRARSPPPSKYFMLKMPPLLLALLRLSSFAFVIEEHVHLQNSDVDMVTSLFEPCGSAWERSL